MEGIIALFIPITAMVVTLLIVQSALKFRFKKRVLANPDMAEKVNFQRLFLEHPHQQKLNNIKIIVFCFALGSGIILLDFIRYFNDQISFGVLVLWIGFGFMTYLYIADLLMKKWKDEEDEEEYKAYDGSLNEAL